MQSSTQIKELQLATLVFSTKINKLSLENINTKILYTVANFFVYPYHQSVNII